MFWCVFFLCVMFASWRADAQLSGRFVVGCPAVCDTSTCPRAPADCAAGQSLDACHCCPVCASGEGEACGGGGSGKLGDPVCGEGLQCSAVVAHSATVRRRGKSGVCVCTSAEPVCGSDGVSYRSLCELKRVSRRAQKLQQPPVLFIQRGACGKGEASANSSTSVLNVDIKTETRKLYHVLGKKKKRLGVGFYGSNTVQAGSLSEVFSLFKSVQSYNLLTLFLH